MIENTSYSALALQGVMDLVSVRKGEDGLLIGGIKGISAPILKVTVAISAALESVARLGILLLAAVPRLVGLISGKTFEDLTQKAKSALVTILHAVGAMGTIFAPANDSSPNLTEESPNGIRVLFEQARSRMSEIYAKAWEYPQVTTTLLVASGMALALFYFGSSSIPDKIGAHNNASSSDIGSSIFFPTGKILLGLLVIGGGIKYICCSSPDKPTKKQENEKLSLEARRENLRELINSNRHLTQPVNDSGRRSRGEKSSPNDQSKKSNPPPTKENPVSDPNTMTDNDVYTIFAWEAETPTNCSDPDGNLNFSFPVSSPQRPTPPKEDLWLSQHNRKT